MRDDGKPLVVVLSRNAATGLSVIRSLGAAGYTIDLVASAYKEGKSIIASSSKYVNNSVEIVSKKVKDGGDDELMEELLKYAEKSDEKIVLFPTDDYTTSIIDVNRSVLEKHFIMPTIIGGGDGCLTERMNKTVQGNLAKQAGLLVPKEWIISLEKSIKIPQDVEYPCFCKPIESITGYKSEMAVCNTYQELRRHLEKLQSRFANRDVLVQEFLEIDYEIDLSGVCLDEEIIIPAIIKKTNVGQYEKGVTLSGNVVPFDEVGEIKDKIINMLKSFHYFGMFDMEFNVVGDKIYFNEVNLRSGGPNYAYYMSGVNLPALFVKEALGQGHTADEECVTEYGKSFIYEKVAWNDYIHGYITKKELNDCINHADIKLLYNDEDPIPGQIFIKDIKKTALKKKLKRIKWKTKKKVRVKGSFVKRILFRYPQTLSENQRDANAEKPRVMVTGRNYSSNLCMARSLGEAGYDVEVLRIFQVRPRRKNLMKKIKPDAYSKYIKAYYSFVSRRSSKRIVKRLISLADLDNKMLLIPADDLLASIVDDYYQELSEYYFLPNVNQNPGEMKRLMNKEVQKNLAKDAGLPVINSCVIKTKNGEFTIPESVNYPCFIKPNISKNSSKKRMRKCDSREELRETLEEFSARKDIEMLVEDYVDIAKEYSILGVCAKDAVAGPGLFVAERGGHDARRGVALIGRVLPSDYLGTLLDDCNKFIASLNFEGLYDVDLIETTDGELYFVEVNMRFGASGYAITKCGVNLPGMYADYVLFGKPIDTNCKMAEVDKTFVSEKVMIDEYLNNFITKADMKNIMDSVDIHFVKNDQDPQAYKHFKKFYWIVAVMRKIYARRA